MGAMSSRRLGSLVGDLADGRPPLYSALASRVRLLVADGRLPVGVRLPAERELAATLGVSRATVSAAYARLREDGWASARQGAGTWSALPVGPERGAWVPAPVDDGVIDLAHAAPSAPPEVPAAFLAALRDLPRLLPGHGYHPAGLPDLRARIAERYTARGLPTTPEEVFVTAGALHGISVTFQGLFRRGQRLLIEHPTYPNALDAARAAGLRVMPAVLDAAESAEWLDTVDRVLHTARPAAAYLMPDFQNPTGRLLDEAGRERLAGALGRTGTTAVVDETFVDLGLDAVPAPPLAAFGPGHVSVGSLSKSFWGGLRVGWVRADAGVIERLVEAAVRSQMSGPVVEQLAAGHLLDGAESALEEHRERLREGRAVLVDGLRRRLPEWRFTPPAGGLVLWCRLPGRRSTALAVEGERQGLRLAPGPYFGTGHAFEDRLRLPFTQPPEVLRRAIDLLAEVDAGTGTAPKPVGYRAAVPVV